jgi:PsbP-like protein
MLSKALNIQIQIVSYRFIMYDDQQTKGNLRFCIRTEVSTSVLLLLVSCCLLSITIILWTPRLAAGVTTTNSVHFITYENSTYGIKMQYPSNWQKIETEDTSKGNNDNDKPIVEFKLPSSIGANLVHKNDQATFIILIHKLPPQNMISKIISSFDSSRSQEISFKAFVLSHLTNLLIKLPDFHLIKSESGGTTLRDNTPAHKLVYTYSGGGEKGSNVIKDMEIVAVKDDEGYIIRYLAQEPTFFDNLPHIQEIVKSFSITK